VRIAQLLIRYFHSTDPLTHVGDLRKFVQFVRFAEHLHPSLLMAPQHVRTSPRTATCPTQAFNADKHSAGRNLVLKLTSRKVR